MCDDLRAIESPEQAEGASARLCEVEREFMLTADQAVLLSLAREVINLRAILSAYRLRAEIRFSRESRPTLGGERPPVPEVASRRPRPRR